MVANAFCRAHPAPQHRPGAGYRFYFFFPASTEWTLDAASPDSRLMARKPKPVFLSARTSQSRLWSEVGRPSLTPRARAASRLGFRQLRLR